MHELGVVFYVIKDVKQAALENGASRVGSVTLEIGEVSGILHDYLTDCWNWARKKEEMLQDTDLVIETIKAVTHCEDCGGDYPTLRYAKICPYCGSENTYLLTGNEFMIKQITVPSEDSGSVPG